MFESMFGMISVLGAGWLAVILIIFNVMKELDDRWVSADVKSRIADYLTGVSEQKLVTIASESFTTLFDRIFGARHFTMRCFLISSSLSMAIFFLLFVLVKIKFFLDYGDEFGDDGIYWGGSFWEVIVGVFIIAIIANILPDYFSLLESRYVISKLSKPTSISLLLFWGLLDVIASVLIFCIYYLILWNTLLLIDPDLYQEAFVSKWFEADYKYMFGDNYVGRKLAELYYLIIGYLPVFGETKIGTVFLLTTLSTSVWIWLHALGVIFTKFVQRLMRPLSFMKTVLNIREKPFSILSIGIMAVFSLVYWTIALIMI